MKNLLIIFLLLFGFTSKAQVYKTAEYKYSVQVFDKEGKEANVLFRKQNCINKDNAWDLIPKDSINDNVISFFSMKFMMGTVNGDQKAYFLRYYNPKQEKLRESVTGLIEEDSKIWFHPPRSEFFKILQLNPFPEIRFNEKEWTTSLKVGSQWGNKRWKTWKGNIIIKSNYKKEGNKIFAIGISELGTTKLITTFDIAKGFTDFEYENIDGSKVVFKLVEIIE